MKLKSLIGATLFKPLPLFLEVKKPKASRKKARRKTCK